MTLATRRATLNLEYEPKPTSEIETTSTKVLMPAMLSYPKEKAAYSAASSSNASSSSTRREIVGWLV
jgi:hypothetical protein